MKKTILSVIIIFCLSFPQAFAWDIPDESNTTVISEDGLIWYVGNSEYSETGAWTADGCGFSDHEKRIAQDAGASAKWSGVRPGDNGYYEVYVWKNVVENGDKNVSVAWFATGSSSGTSIMDCSEGESGWQYLGVCNTSDLVFDLEITASGTGNASACAFRLVRTTKEAFLNYLGGEEGIVLKINAENALVNGNKVPMDMGKAVIKDSRTMIPVRFVSEKIGADVNWNEEEKRVDIKYGENELSFYIGRCEYLQNGEKKEFDSAPYIEDSRTMIPARALAEALGKKVYWDARGVVVISEKEFSDYTDITEKGLGL